ncbi:hypothetical protein PHAVU_001G026400 [Phaseolus vulgaris]|uniref:Uncharacterized protein n=1 Tax=Phaseolus vulgaris TaxID=3885 RepID=V7CU27_PHAVU|nr:hypothetical protein PHAVU_001G026400g [Phaseolus vulgaris]XP_007160900.1 hypothetical protein PHAVU_001G026400g [Phaseolus vulgaris]ESW32893.1 hypothetical protein PHAVU_001G026400g [Phaseolus vulgaris]ESW32894.1 hypothetical protein PHAVU_001G026400g [Phaseolus vulgaris]
MKVSGLFALLLVVGATVMFYNVLGPTGTSAIPDLVETNHGDKAKRIAVSRKLKENGIESGNMGQVSLTDYGAVDPVPNSSKAIQSGPIEYGSPLNPYIPKLSPPDHPKPGDSN